MGEIEQVEMFPDVVDRTRKLITSRFRGRSALVTGMTPTQCGSSRTALRIATAAAAIARALEAAGFMVYHGVVDPGDDLSCYDVVMVGLSKPNAIACGNMWSGLEAIRQRPDATFYVDDWQVDDIIAGFRCYARDHQRITRLERRGLEQARALKIVADLAAVVDSMADGWTNRTVVPIHGGPNGVGDLSLLGLPPRCDVLPWDPSTLIYPYPVPPVAKERRWLFASLLQKPEELARYQAGGWPVAAFGNAARGRGGVGRSDRDAQNRIPEPELAVEYARSWGVVSPAHRVSGSGWWRVRYQIAASVRSIVSGPMSEARLLGPAYILAANPQTVMEMTDATLERVAQAQRENLEAITTPRSAAVESLARAVCPATFPGDSAVAPLSPHV